MTGQNLVNNKSICLFCNDTGSIYLFKEAYVFSKIDKGI